MVEWPFGPEERDGDGLATHNREFHSLPIAVKSKPQHHDPSSKNSGFWGLTTDD
jgi:hypothetical protein